MKKSLLVIILFLVFLIIFFILRGQEKKEVSFRELQIGRGDLVLNVLATGTVLPQNRVEIKAPVPGRMEKILIKEGEKLKKGQTIAWMSSLERAAMLDSSRAQGEEEYQKWSELFLATPIISPISGTLILRSVEPGQTFTSAESIFSMSDRLTVKAQVDETDIAKIKISTPAKIVLDAYPDFIVGAQVDKIAFDARVINNVTTYLVDVVPKTIPEFMRSGMTANVIFETEIRQNVLLVPNEAIKVEGNSYWVNVSVPGKNSVIRQVKVGENDGKQTEIVSGLSEGDVILIQLENSSAMDGENRKKNIFLPMGGGHGPRR